MDSNTDIGQMIASSPAPEGEVNLCKAERINDFFENLPTEVRRLWPFDLTNEGYETAYISANYTEQHSFRSLKEKQTLELSGIFRNERELYVFDGCYTLEDEQLRFELRSLYKEKGLPQRRFAYLLMERQQRFLTAYDNSRPFDFYDKPSEIRLIAASGKDANGLPINGGQVWATLGMNFFSLTELQNCRSAFEKFAVEKANVRFSRRDLKAFTKPCHFAVFDNGVKLSVGGGKEISKWVEKSGMTPEFKNGLRVTDEPTMEIAEMVLNKVNKSLVSLIEELGVKACGISGKDGGMLKVEKKYSKGEDIGYVGEVKEVDTTLIHSLLKDDFLPVICPIGYDDNFHAYNINADDAACAIARAVNAEKLAFLTDIEGVYKDYNDKSSLISELSTTEARQLLAGGTIGGGMLPKLNNCIDAIEHGVSRVHILDGRIPHCLLLEIFTNKGVGTAILSEGAEKFFDTNI